MCGICLLFKLKVDSDLDYESLKRIKEYNCSYEENGGIDNNSYNSDSNLNNENVQINFNPEEENISSLVKVIKNRGPDFLNSIEITKEGEVINNFDQILCEKLINFKNTFDYIESSGSMIMISSVLSLRGVYSDLTKQPIYDNSTCSNILQYNGEVYNIKGNFDNAYDIYKQNDGLILFDIFNNISKIVFDSSNYTNDEYASLFFEYMNKIESDHALVFYDRQNSKIVLNRDIFGKRSLILIHFKLKDIFLISSALTESLSKLDSSTADIIEVPANSIVLFDLSSSTKQRIFFYHNPLLDEPSSLRFPKLNNVSSYLNSEQEIKNECFNLLNKSVYKRVCNLPDIVKLNKDSEISISVLYSGGIDSLLLAYFTIVNIPDEMNISIDLINLSFDKQNAPDRNSGLISYYELKKLFPNKKIKLILVDKNFDGDVEPIKDTVKALIFPKQTHMDFNIATALKLATKIEGNLVIDHLFFEHMDKYFEVLYSKDSQFGNKQDYNNNILSKKLEVINYTGFIQKDIYKSTSKIVLSGLGADEMFGGYARYKSSFNVGGKERLKEEMSKDINRIWTRNFGRDDRVCSDNGIELRFPFFDLELIDFLASVEDIKHVTDFTLPRGEGEKLLLRQICREIGFKISYQFEKRAIQFGTKLAKETNIKKYGSNRKANGKAQFK